MADSVFYLCGDYPDIDIKRFVPLPREQTTALNVDDINHIAALAQKGIPLFHIPALLQNRSQLVGQEIFDKCSHLHEDRYVDVKIDTFLRISKDSVRQRCDKNAQKWLPDT